MKKWIPTLTTLGSIALTMFTPQIQHTISAHPVVATVLAGAAAVINHVLPSPVTPQQ